MDIDEIKRRIEDIQNDADHPEKTLSDKGSNEEYLRQKEGYLWYKVLEAIANGADNPQELAKEDSSPLKGKRKPRQMVLKKCQGYADKSCARILQLVRRIKWNSFNKAT